MTQPTRYKIGELARLSGVSVKTLRFYADQGVLPPSEVTESGHRWYTDLDHARLEAVRSLRDVGVGLDTIKQLMQHEDSMAEALKLQLETVELELSQLQRRRAVLSAALRRGDALTYLRGARTLAALGATERNTFLSKRVGQMLQGVPADPDWLQGMWGKQLLNLPEQLSDVQFEAWLELADLLTNEDFIANSRRIGQEHWGQFLDEAHRNRFMQDSQILEKQISAAVQQGHPPQSSLAQDLIHQHLVLLAKAFGKAASVEFAKQQLDNIRRNTDPRGARFWQLLAVLHGWPRQNNVQPTHEWKVAALECWITAGAQGSTAATSEKPGNAQGPG